MAVIKISRTVALDAPILTEALHGTLFTTEGQAHEFTIHCTQGGAAVTLSGTVTAKFIREETGDTILCAGSLSAGAAVVTLPADCYHRSGRFSMTVFVTSGSVATVVYACTGTVKAAEDGTLIDQGGVVPSIDEILQELDGKVSKSGDTMTGRLVSSASTKLGQFAVVHGLTSTEACARYERTDTGVAMYTGIGSAGTNHGVYSYVKNGWMVVCDGSGNVTLNGTAENVSGTVAVANGGTGATTASGALTNLGYANTSFNQAGGTLAGALSSPGVWLVTVHDSANLANYWTGIGNRVSGANPTFVTIANNGISAPYGNTIGTVVFSGATGNYVARCVKLL